MLLFALRIAGTSTQANFWAETAIGNLAVNMAGQTFRADGEKHGSVILHGLAMICASFAGENRLQKFTTCTLGDWVGI